MEKYNDTNIDNWAAGRCRDNALPWLVYISVTNRCNSNCTVCGHGKVMREDKGDMNVDVFKKIVDQLPSSVKKVYLFKQGEPFLNKNLEAFVEYLREKHRDVHIAIHTNGINAAEERVRKILPLIDSMGISISATSESTYKAVHGVNQFSRICDNIHKISNLMLESKKNKALYRGTPHVFIDYIQQEKNASEKEQDVVKFFKTNFPGLSSIDFHWVYNFQGEIKEGNMKVYENVPFEKFPCCVFPWGAMTFCYDGRVAYCFVEPREKRFMGDIRNQSLQEIWNGDQYRVFRERMRDKKFEQLLKDGIYCKRCSWLWSMRAQSPKNLCGGYSLMKGTAEKTDFAGLLESSHEDALKLGKEFYLKGEIHTALGIFDYIKGTCESGGILEESEVMLEKCRRVLHKFVDLQLWQTKLADECSPQEKQCRYYPLGENKK